MLLFLYAKGILKQKASAVRRADFAALLTPDGMYEESLQRLRRLVLEGERSDVLDECNSFTRFLDSVPTWQDNAASYVAFRDNPRISCCGLLERVQLSGLCYMHAPIVLQAYLVAMHSGSQTGTSKMLDLADYIRKYRTAQELEDHIFRDEGGSSRVFLAQILANASGLVGFDCTSMVEEDVGQDRFLLQNWWSDKGFIEVDAEYLAGQEASLVFVQSDQPDIPVQFTRSSARHVELEMTVKERLPMEM
ncbi:unnamed protein product [Symbiodinium sp. KB8]|nr:unnamed protein product [Symbiodinium sp. KB8]